jgi:hypothetical protein
MGFTMQFKKYMLLLSVAAGLLSTKGYAQDGERGQQTGFERQLNEIDDDAVKDFVRSKESIELKEKTSHLEISGDVRFEWRNLHEKGDVVLVKDKHFVQEYRSLRGGDAVDFRGLPISNNDWDAEFNLKFKYNYGRAWAAAHLQFDNSAGIRGYNDCRTNYPVNVLHCCDPCSDDKVSLSRDMRLNIKGSGDAGAISLKRAYMGYNIWADGVHRFDVEIGRRKLDDVFQSEIQFSSRFDGILLKYASAIDQVADFYFYGGAFIIDERVNHYGCAGEVGFLNIADTGLDLRYSLIDWRQKSKNRCFIRDALGTDFLNSQVSFSYFYITQIFCKDIPTELYGGFLINHAARKTIFTHHKRANLGWYAGLYLGAVKKQGDWALDIEYTYVQAQAANDADVSGICRGNIQDDHLTDILFDPSGEIAGCDQIFVDTSCLDESIKFSNLGCYSGSEINAFLPRRGNANYRGAKIEFLYAITDNFSLDAEIEVTQAVDNKIGGRHYYANYEIEFIYAF